MEAKKCGILCYPIREKKIFLFVHSNFKISTIFFQHVDAKAPYMPISIKYFLNNFEHFKNCDKFRKILKNTKRILYLFGTLGWNNILELIQTKSFLLLLFN